MEPNQNNNKDHWIIHTYKQAKRLVMIVVGFTILLMGIAMLVLPGPGIITIIAGLAILATEFVWARQLLHKMKERAKNMHQSLMKKNNKKN